MESLAPKYYAWGLDNISYGPVELPVLVTWIKDGRIPATSWVYKEPEGAWSRASDVPELKVLFKSKLTPNAAAAASTLGIQPGSLRRIKLLSQVDDNLLMSLLPYLKVFKAPQFGTVVRQGDIGDSLYMILEGEVRARINIGGRETTLAVLGVGECFGEIALLDHGPRSADIIANEPSTLLEISAANLRKMLAEAPALASPFMFELGRMLTHRMRQLSKQYEDSIQFARAAGLESRI